MVRAAKGKALWSALLATAALLGVSAAEASLPSNAARAELLARPALAETLASSDQGKQPRPRAFASSDRGKQPRPFTLDLDGSLASEDLEIQPRVDRWSLGLVDRTSRLAADLEAEKLASGVKTWSSADNIWRLRYLGRVSQWCAIAYARNRWYDPRNATWLSEDPLGDVDSPNLYAFVGWQPQMHRDPLGLQSRARRAVTAVEDAFRIGGRAIRNLKFKGRSISTEILRHESGVSSELLAMLDKRFPGLEVPFNEKGYVEFEQATSRVVFGEVSIGSFSGNSKADVAKAWKEYQAVTGLADDEIAVLRQEYRMHHDYNEGRMLLVDINVHDAYQHTGGNAAAKAKALATTVATTAAAVVLPRTTEALQGDKSLTDKAIALGTDVAMNTELGWVEVPQAVEGTAQAASEGLWDRFQKWLDSLGWSRTARSKSQNKLVGTDTEVSDDTQ
jgi:RHS repeat-associated protein